MAFDRPVQSDTVDDLGLFSSFLRAPVVGTILWFLGGEHAKESEKRGRTDKGQNIKLEDAERGWQSEETATENNHVSDHDDDEWNCRNLHSKCVDQEKEDINQDQSETHEKHSDEIKNNKEREVSALESWPVVGVLDSDEDDLDPNHFPNYEKFITSDISTPTVSKRTLKQNIDIPAQDITATRVINELMAVLDTSSLTDAESVHKSKTSKRFYKRTDTSSASTNLATSAITIETTKFSSKILDSEISSSSTDYPQIAHELSDKKTLSASLSSSLNHNNQSSSSIKSKKTSWSDECGHRSLVEYFDDSPAKRPCRYQKSNSWKPSRSTSFDSEEKPSLGNRGGRSEVKVIKSALRRSGSYSPPIPSYGALSSKPIGHSSSISSSSPLMKSFRSLSVIGSTSSGSTCSDHSNSPVLESQCVPSTLAIGHGRGSVGLVIPGGGPCGLSVFSKYDMTFGSGISPRREGVTDDQEEPMQNKDAKITSTPNIQDDTVTAGSETFPSVSNGRTHSNHSKHHHFLPNHGNGYVSPQYGFYVNITPPTPEVYFQRQYHHSNNFNSNVSDKSSKPSLQQSYQQFQYNKPFRPSPIPEVTTVASPQVTEKLAQPVFQDNQTVNRPLKSTFKKNKARMGMLLSENPHQVWPTVPFG